MTRQTTIQVPEAIRKGSVRVLIGNDFDSLVDVGALRNPVITALTENQSVEFDNVDALRKFVRGTRLQVTFDLAEINLTNMAKFDDGLINLTTVTGALVAGAEQLVVVGSWAYNKFIKITNQNGDATIPTVNSVTGSTSGALAEDTDFYVGQDENGVWGIFIIQSGSGTPTEDQNITIDYDYTPNEAKRITFNESGSKILRAMRLVNIDENDKEFRIDIENGTNMAPISIDFAGDDEDNVAILPIDFQGNLVELIDEQQIA